MNEKKEVLELDQVYEELRRIYRDIEELSVNGTAILSFNAIVASNIIASIKAQRLLLKSDIKSLEELHKYCKNKEPTYFGQYEKVLEHQINALSKTCSLIGNSFNQVIKELGEFDSTSFELGQSLDKLLNEDIFKSLS